LGVNSLLNTAPQPNGVTSSAGTSRTAAPAPAPTGPDRYLEIHKNLKVLRKSLTAQAKTNPRVKARMGDMRRELRKAVGQLTPTQGVAGVNKIQVWRSLVWLNRQYCLPFRHSNKPFSNCCARPCRIRCNRR
jgi:nucleoporin GLE1